MTYSSLRFIAAAAALAIPSLVGCDASAANSPSVPPSAQSVIAQSPASLARTGALTTQEQDVIAALKGYEAAITSEDTTALKKIWAEEYSFINPQGGIVTREQRLDNLRSGATNVVEGINQREIVVHVFGDMAVVTQLFTLRGTFSGVVTDQEVRGSFTWLKRAGRWQLVFNEITPVLS
jgi:ketosteroid isomerase-like protein